MGKSASWKSLPARLPFAMFALVASTLLLLLAGVMYVVKVPGGRDVKWWSPRTSEVLVYAAAQVALWAVVRVLIAAVFLLIQTWAYLTLPFYMMERTQWSVSLTLWAILSLVLLVWYVQDYWLTQDDRDVALQVYATVAVAFAGHTLKNALERLWLQSIHEELYGDILTKHIGKELTICRLQQIRRENENTWITERAPAHTHSVLRTLRGLLGDSLDESPFLYPNDELRDAAAAHGSDILLNLDVEDKGYFTLDDVEDAIGPGHGDRAIRMFSTFAPTKRSNLGTLRVTYEATLAVIYELFSKRENLYRTLHALGSVSNELHRFTNIVYWLLALVVFTIWFYGIEGVISLVLPLGGFVFGAAFAFGDTVRSYVAGFILLFSRRPFSHGSRIRVEGHPTMIVENLELLQTTLRTTDGMCVVMPNAVLATKTIHLDDRSKSYACQAEVSVRADITPDELRGVEQELMDFFRTDSTSPWAWDDVMVWVSSLDHSHHAKISVWVGLVGVNWAMPSVYLVAQSRLRLQLQHIVRALDLPYTGDHMHIQLQ